MKPILETGALTVSALVEVTRRRRANGPLDPRWSFRTELFQTMVRRMMDRTLVKGPQWLRAVQAAVPSALPPALRKAVRFETVVADGVPCQWVWPVSVPSSGPDGAIVYLHGGGYVSGTLDTHRELTARIAAGAGVPVLAVDYRLAPEHRHPAAHDDCLRAVRWLRARGVAAQLLLRKVVRAVPLRRVRRDLGLHVGTHRLLHRALVFSEPHAFPIPTARRAGSGRCAPPPAGLPARSIP